MEDDHIPLKDEFSNDQSDIDIDEKDDEIRFYTGSMNKDKKIKKKNKNFIWKNKWIKIPNAIINSGPILMKKWVKIKLNTH
jgi:hypothetical protein